MKLKKPKAKKIKKTLRKRIRDLLVGTASNVAAAQIATTADTNAMAKAIAKSEIDIENLIPIKRVNYNPFSPTGENIIDPAWAALPTKHGTAEQQRNSKQPDVFLRKGKIVRRDKI